MLLGVRVKLSCDGFGTLFEVGFQDRALPLVWDAVRYALFFERAKPVGTDPVRLHFYEAISYPHLNHEECRQTPPPNCHGTRTWTPPSGLGTVQSESLNHSTDNPVFGRRIGTQSLAEGAKEGQELPGNDTDRRKVFVS